MYQLLLRLGSIIIGLLESFAHENTAKICAKNHTILNAVFVLRFIFVLFFCSHMRVHGIHSYTVLWQRGE